MFSAVDGLQLEIGIHVFQLAVKLETIDRFLALGILT